MRDFLGTRGEADSRLAAVFGQIGLAIGLNGVGDVGDDDLQIFKVRDVQLHRLDMATLGTQFVLQVNDLVQTPSADVNVVASPMPLLTPVSTMALVVSGFMDDMISPCAVLACPRLR
ncbi:hypothetical protein ACT4VD_05125 [Acinetobacter baumannii]